jgi:hypothetical protein
MRQRCKGWNKKTGADRPPLGPSPRFRCVRVMSVHAPRAALMRTLRIDSFGPGHKVAALQPAARGQEPRGQQAVERSAIAGWHSQHINNRTLHSSACSSRLATSARQSPDDVASHIDSTCNAMTRIGLTIAQTRLFECAVGQFCSQEIDLRHAAEHRSTDQSRNGCRMCYFCHEQLFEIT